MKRIFSIAALGVFFVGTLFAALPSNAAQIDSPTPGVTVNQNTPNYVVTIDCDSLPYGGQELYTGRTQRGSYTLNFSVSCQDNARFTMQVDDNGDTDEVGGYTLNGTRNNTSPGYIDIPASVTLHPDTYVTILRSLDNDFFNVRYNGSDENQTEPEPTETPEPTSTPLANTGFDSVFYSLIAFTLMIIGFGAIITSHATRGGNK